MVRASVVLPCRNEVDFIDHCLSSVLQQDAGSDSFEVIVVDGMSDDGTRERLAAWTSSDPRVRVIDNPMRIVPTALNLGVVAAAGEVIVRMDVHSQYPPDYLRRCLATLETQGADNVGGVLITVPRGAGIEAGLVQAVSTHRFGVGASDFRVGSRGGPVDTVPFGCFPKGVFARLGGFDERLVRNQDVEFNGRIRAAGGTVWLDPDIRLEYFNQPNLAGLFRQARDTGRWNVWTWHLAPHAFRLRHAVPLLFVSFLIIGGLLAALFPSSAPWYFAVLILYLVLAIGAAVQQALRYRRPMLTAALPATFFAYHLSYGLGSLLGAALLLLGRVPYRYDGRAWPDTPVFAQPEARQTGP